MKLNEDKMMVNTKEMSRFSYLLSQRKNIDRELQELSLVLFADRLTFALSLFNESDLSYPSLKYLMDDSLAMPKRMKAWLRKNYVNILKLISINLHNGFVQCKMCPFSWKAEVVSDVNNFRIKFRGLGFILVKSPYHGESVSVGSDCFFLCNTHKERYMKQVESEMKTFVDIDRFSDETSEQDAMNFRVAGSFEGGKKR
jgi:hypothetical protein